MSETSDWKLVHATTGHGYLDSQPCTCPLCDAVMALVRGNRLRESDLKARLTHIRRRGPHFSQLLRDEWERTLNLRIKNWRPQ